MSENQTKPAPPDWRTDTLKCWQRLPNKAFFFALLAVWAVLFQFWGNSILGYVHTPSLFEWLYNFYNVGGEQNEKCDFDPADLDLHATCALHTRLGDGR